MQGRFTSLDPLLASGKAGNPQSWNRFAYAFNNPTAFIDPSGMEGETPAPVSAGPSGEWLAWWYLDMVMGTALEPDDEDQQQGTASSSCSTAEFLLGWDKLRTVMNEAWDKSQKANEEFGGWVVWDRTTNQTYVQLSSWSGITLKTPSGIPLSRIWEEGYAWRLYAGDKTNLVRVVDFHTHLSGSTRSYDDVFSLRESGRSLGIEIRGKDNFSVYGTSFSKDEAESSDLRKCLPE